MTLTTDDYESVARELNAVVLDQVREQFRARYNVAPGDVHWLLRAHAGQRELGGATWGLPRDDGGLLVNARAERVAQSANHRVAFLRGRCCVIADGFYEWSGPRHDRQPWWFHGRDGGLLLIGGLFVDYVDPDDGHTDSRFVVLTTRANREVAAVHDRMPLLIAPDRIDAWLREPDEWRLGALLGPAPDASLEVRPVSKLVNRTGNEDPRCIEAIPTPPRQGSLFDRGA